MTPAEVFKIVGMLAMPMWILMVFLPKWKVTRFFIDYKIIPILLSIIYVIYIIQAMQIGGGMDFGSLQSVMALFTEEHAVLAGWIHYLAFDLLVGMWILNQNKTIKIHHLLIIPCLLSSFMLGPVGFLLFMIMRAIKLKKA
ncbi:ABA4-like family protein [Kordia jejudonensis]|uniref:ABA4-like family protein n=1 Tax=Kordia jejudonensis TaxID=1348245 RepID=UPI0006295196|nr:ABA4-like family protein [Kordia jejudonensis]